MVAVNHSIKMVAKRTGLSPHVIRIWEKRYQAVTPSRTSTNRRLYSDREVERLNLLKLATHAGHSIRNVAALPDEDLRGLVDQDVGQDVGRPAPEQRIASVATPDSTIENAIAAIRQLDAEGLETLLNRAVTAYGQPRFLQRILVPLIDNIGQMWADGVLKVAHEHIASATLRTFLGNLSRAHAVPPTAPELIVTTPAGQLHELGAVLVTAFAGNLGWRVTYLGPCLPAEEIAGAVLQNRARAVALSIVYPEDDPRLGNQLTTLRKLLPAETPILVGGRSARAYGAYLTEIDAIVVDDLAGLKAGLDQIRRTHSGTRVSEPGTASP